jgi:hypothetical protein
MAVPSIEEYAKIINRFTAEFTSEYCDKSGVIDLDKIAKV